jgi:ketosteroid isomerase-like protein
VTGSAAIRDVLAGFLASRPVMEFDHTYMFVSGDTALARGRWKLTSTGADGAAETIVGTSIEVLRRQADGSWRYVIDHPWGGD